MKLSEDEYNALISRRAMAAGELPLSGGKRVIRQSRREPNKTEKRFEIEKLHPMYAAGQIGAYRYEAITLKLANGLRYTADWSAIRFPAGKLILWEIKGGRPRQREAGISALKMAANCYPEFEFWLFQWKGGMWIPQEVLA